MGIRSLLQNQKVATIVGILSIGVVALAVFLQLKPASKQSAPTKAFYTVDDGTTYFADVISNAPPFEHDGQQAVRALVLVGANGKTFVASLLRFSPAKKRDLDAMIAKDRNSLEVHGTLLSGMDEIKKPRLPNAKWVILDSPAGSAAAIFETPAGVTQPTQVLEP